MAARASDGEWMILIWRDRRGQQGEYVAP
ncbi:uncharacterized protein G2W53_009081 [Senna tora]|uniref:Uncharacterized protein n=1 Tax=Senna tora TaxID=362788 RepID=A0A834WXW0_9FABA|nr:uncharacterized protein G2W53_009081 [Senna tora]